MGIADLSTHQNFLSASLRRVTQRLYDRAGGTEIEVGIKTGLQAGATRRLRLARMLVGAGPENDLTLIDDAVDQQHLILEFQRSIFGHLVDVTAKGPGVVIAGETLAVGKRADALRLPLEITIGDSRIAFDRAVTKNAQPRSIWNLPVLRSLARLDPVILLASIVLVGILLGSVIGAVMPRSGSSLSFVVQEPQPREIRVAAATAPRNWKRDVEEQAALLSLDRELSVGLDQEGLIKVTGSVPTAKNGALRELQNWYDGQASSPLIIWDINRQTKLENMPAVSMVRISAPAEVVLASGIVAKPGDRLVDDWILTEINASDLVLTRGAERTVVAHVELVK